MNQYLIFYNPTRETFLADATPDTRVVTVEEPNDPPDGTIDKPLTDQTIAAGGSVDFTGTGSDPDHDLPLLFLSDVGG